MKAWNIARLVFLNVLVIDSLRNLPIIGQLGTNLFVLYIIVALIFLLPVAYISRRIAQVGTQRGSASIYQFTAMELGNKAATVQEILLWVYNVLWYPTLIIFLAHFIYPMLHLPISMMTFALLILIPLVLLSTLPVTFSSSLSSIMALCGAIIPMLVLSIYAYIHIFSQPNFHNLSYFVPHVSQIKLEYVPTVFFSLMGIELATMHSDVLFTRESEWNVALWISVPLILFLLIGCGLGIWEFGQQQFLSSLTVALSHVFQFLPNWLVHIIIFAVAISVLFQAIFWMQATATGMTKAITNQTRWLPVRLTVIIQAVITFAIMFLILSSNSFNHSFLYVSNLSVLLAVIYYAILTISFFKYCKTHKKSLMWPCIGMVGMATLFLTTLFTL